MPRKPRGRGNGGRGRGNNGQDHRQPRLGGNGAAAIVLDREEKRIIGEEKSEGTLEEMPGQSQRTSNSRNQQSANTARSTEVKSEEKNAIPLARSQEERPGPNGVPLRPQTAPFVKPVGNSEKCEQTQESCVASPASKG